MHQFGVCVCYFQLVKREKVDFNKHLGNLLECGYFRHYCQTDLTTYSYSTLWMNILRSSGSSSTSAQLNLQLTELCGS